MSAKNQTKHDDLAVTIQPIGDRVLVEPLEKEQVSASGIVIPETASKEKPQLIDDAVEALCALLMNEPLRYRQLLKEISHRFFLIKSYNVNKRLQLEAMF